MGHRKKTRAASRRPRPTKGETPRPVDDPETVGALEDLGRILMEIAETARGATEEGQAGVAGPSDSKIKCRRQSNRRRVKGGQRRDRK